MLCSNNATIKNLNFNKSTSKTHQSTGSPLSFLHCGVNPTHPVTRNKKINNITRVATSALFNEVTLDAGSLSRFIYDSLHSKQPLPNQTIQYLYNRRYRFVSFYASII